ncbi:putative AAA ATPase, AAA+ lid domain-containing protein [Helianthus anomalus]
MTEGCTGSDLKNLCTTAAYWPVRELIQQERLKDMEKKRFAESSEGLESPEEKYRGEGDQDQALEYGRLQGSHESGGGKLCIGGIK